MGIFERITGNKEEVKKPNNTTQQPSEMVDTQQSSGMFDRITGNTTTTPTSTPKPSYQSFNPNYATTPQQVTFTPKPSYQSFNPNTTTTPQPEIQKPNPLALRNQAGVKTNEGLSFNPNYATTPQPNPLALRNQAGVETNEGISFVEKGSSALGKGMGRFNIGVLGTLKNINKPLSFLSEKLEEAFTGKDIARYSDPISLALDKAMEQVEKDIVPLQANLENLGWVEDKIYSALTSLPQIAPLFMGAPVGLAKALIGITAYGNKQREVEKRFGGNLSLAEEAKSQVAALGTGILEVATESGPLGRISELYQGKAVAKNLVMSGLEEFVGETISEFFSPAIDQVYDSGSFNSAYVDNLGKTMVSSLDAGLTGLVGGVMFGGAAVGVNNINQMIENPSSDNVNSVIDKIEQKTGTDMSELRIQANEKLANGTIKDTSPTAQQQVVPNKAQQQEVAPVQETKIVETKNREYKDIEKDIVGIIEKNTDDGSLEPVGNFQFFGIRFETKARKVGEIIEEYTKDNTDRADERDFPEYGTDEYNDLPELDGSSAWYIQSNNGSLIDDSKAIKNIDFQNDTVDNYAYLVGARDVVTTENPDYGEIVFEQPTVLAIVGKNPNQQTTEAPQAPINPLATLTQANTPTTQENVVSELTSALKPKQVVPNKALGESLDTSKTMNENIKDKDASTTMTLEELANLDKDKIKEFVNSLDGLVEHSFVTDPSTGNDIYNEFGKNIYDEFGKNFSEEYSTEFNDSNNKDFNEDINDVIADAKQYKDVGSYNRWTTDIYRNFKKVFGEDFNTVKKTMLDPFDKAKGNMAKDIIKLTDDLYNKLVVELGIKKSSPESALVMRLGEERITKAELQKEVGKEKADNIIEANKWLRNEYDNLLDEINDSRSAAGLDIIPKRKNYHRHYLDMAQSIGALKNIFDSPSMISPGLEGVSEFTKPNEKWQSIKQKFTGKGKYTEDAVGGFLDYIQAGTYSKHIDPQVKKFRMFKNALVNSVGDSKNINNFLGFLDEFTNSLAGKTNKFDRTVQDLMGRKAFAVVSWANSRMKSNAVLGNISSSLSQIANVPQGIATIKNPKTLTKGATGYFQSIFDGGDVELYKQSDFLRERYINDVFSKFNTKVIDQPKKLAGFVLEVGDMAGSKFIWSSAYRDGINKQVENPIKYADDMTREMVAGRGIGEVPMLQKAKTMQLIAPFTIEVNNVWKVMSGMVNEKDVLGLLILFISDYFLNEFFEKVRGSGVVYDPIGAIIDGYKKEGTFGDKMLAAGTNLLGETISNLPLGSSLAQIYPEYGMKLPVLGQTPNRKDLFGENDPTRYGTGLPLANAMKNPLKAFALPFGGSQVDKTIKGLKATGVIPQSVITGQNENTQEPIFNSMNLPASISNSGKIRTFVEPSPLNILQGIAFGGYASKEVQDFFGSNRNTYGEIQTANILKLVKGGIDPYELDRVMTEVRAKKATTKPDKVAIVENSSFTLAEKKTILEEIYGFTME